MTGFETALRGNMEMLTYGIFFGALILLALLETIIALRAEGAMRRRRWPANFALTAINIVVLGALPLGAVAAADLARSLDIGLLNWLDAPFAAALALTFLARSFGAWGVHYAMHNVPLLWRVHRVHHTDTHLDVSTTVRFHPLEFLISAPVAIGIVIALGLPPAAVMLFELVDAGIAVFSHANIRLPAGFERLLNRIIITPNMHRIHHSTVERETNSNYGATLVIWDRVFGTYQRKERDALERQRLGLDEVDANRASSLWFSLGLPFREIKRNTDGNRVPDKTPGE
ncbi:sterol desaturase family protein [uncultured Hoeflea sp.]|uniref:sterol desaturase family protein n=1 Tax=uncultured Hoeflea sp. TaxID=538666 RepID=UPI00261ED91D|nr:sterol desaturase family protein [uncultured Hoeflea sp.]